VGGCVRECFLRDARSGSYPETTPTAPTAPADTPDAVRHQHSLDVPVFTDQRPVFVLSISKTSKLELVDGGKRNEAECSLQAGNLLAAVSALFPGRVNPP
jgi:hypothetical protein